VEKTRLIWPWGDLGYPVPGKTAVYKEEQFDLNVALNGGVLVKMLAISIDRYLRGRMRDADVEFFSNPFYLGKS
jgi:NADPH-dependent curcumin reductase CurA